jgi:hypothetical protein
MTDRFDIQRGMDNAGEAVAASARERLEAERERERARVKRLVRLSAVYYFDPVEKMVLVKNGSRYTFVRHDRRKGAGKAARKTQVQAEESQFRMITGGLFWDEKAKRLYRKSGKHYVLYSPDRRKIGGSSPMGKERRSKR